MFQNALLPRKTYIVSVKELKSLNINRFPFVSLRVTALIRDPLCGVQLPGQLKLTHVILLNKIATKKKNLCILSNRFLKTLTDILGYFPFELEPFRHITLFETIILLKFQKS